MLRSGLGKYIAPTALGAGYALAKMFSLRALDPELAAAQEFTYQFLAGVLLGFALRPVANMIFWKRATSVIFFSIFLIILGPAGQFLRRLIWGLPFDSSFWDFLLPEIIAAVFVSMIITFLLPPQQEVLSLRMLGRRLRREAGLSGIIKVSGCGLLYALLFLGLESNFDESFVAVSWTGRLQEFLILPPITAHYKLLLLWGQGILSALVLLPLCVVFFRGPVELIVVFGSLTFVVAEFAPAFANFQRIEPLLLMDQVFIGFCLQFLFVSAVVVCFGKDENY